jgi:hypothetical protein
LGVFIFARARHQVAVSTEQRSRLQDMPKAFGLKPLNCGEAVLRASIDETYRPL